MSIRKRILPRTGETRWQVDYRDQTGTRRAKQFNTKAEAVSHETTVRTELRAGTHVSDSASVSVAEAAAWWVQRAELDELEASTIRQYRQHVDLHIKPLLGQRKLSQLSRPAVEVFKDGLLETRSRALAKAILASLKGIIKEAQRRGLAGHNAAADVQVKMQSRHEALVVIPTREHIRALLTTAAEKWPITTVLTDRKGGRRPPRAAGGL